MAGTFHIALESQNEEDCTSAIEVIDSAKLTAIEHLHLKLVIVNAVDTTVAARFILNQVSKISPGCSVEDILRSLKDDLNTLALKCRVKGECRVHIYVSANVLQTSLVARNVSISPEVDFALRKRQNSRCCVSGRTDSLRATHIVSPTILDDPDVQPGVCLPYLLPSTY